MNKIDELVNTGTVSKLSFSSLLVSFFSGVSGEMVVAISTLVAAIIGLLINFIYKRREDRRKDEEHKRLRRLNRLKRQQTTTMIKLMDAMAQGRGPGDTNVLKEITGIAMLSNAIEEEERSDTNIKEL